MEEIYLICPVLKKCPDTRKLRESERRGVVNDDLAEQYNECCTTTACEYCLRRKLIGEK